jgi:hypothetical protein
MTVIATNNIAKPCGIEWMLFRSNPCIPNKLVRKVSGSNIEEKTVSTLIVSFSCSDTVPEYISRIEFTVSR